MDYHSYVAHQRSVSSRQGGFRPEPLIPVDRDT